MLNSTPLRILRSLTPEEIKDFREFISSPFFNKNQNVVKLFDYLRKYYPDFTGEKLEKEFIYNRLYDNSRYNDGFMRTVIFNLSKLLDDYLTYINFCKDEISKGICLLKELNERKVEKVFMKNFKDLDNQNESSLFKDPLYYINKYNLTTQREIHNIWNKSESGSEAGELFRNAYKYLNYFYFGSILKEYRYLIYLSDFSDREYHSEFLEHLINFLSDKDNLYAKDTYINLHLNEIFLQKEKSSKYFYILKDMLKNRTAEISDPDRFSLQNILQIYCIKKVFEGDTSFNNERMDLFKIVLEQNLYSPLKNDYFEATLFANMVSFGISRKEFKWVEKIISDFSGKLLPVHRNTMENYAYAKLDFEKENFIEALQYLNSIVNVRHPLMKLPVKIITLQTLFELDLMEQVFYQIDSLRHYISNNKDGLAPERLERSMNFLKFFNKLAKLKEKLNLNELAKLKKELKVNTNTNERNWLISKANSLVKS